MRRLMEGRNLPSGARESRRLRGILEDLARFTGSADAAGAELRFLLESKADSKAMGRYVDLLEAADGVNLPSVRETFALLEASPDSDLGPAFSKLLKSCGRDARAALAEYRWMDSQLQPADSRSKAARRLAGLWAKAGEATADDIHRSFLNAGPATAAPATPPHLAKALDTIARLTGSRDAARVELRFALDNAAPGPDQQAALDRYVDLLEAADGVELPGVRRAYEHLEKTADADLQKAFLKLVKACGRSATRALDELLWLEGLHPGGPERVQAVKDFAKLVEASEDLAPDAVRQSFLNRQAGGQATQQPAHLRKALATLEDLVGDRQAAATELEALLKNTSAAPDTVQRFVKFVRAAEGLDLPSVRTAFQRIESAPELREPFEAMLEASGRKAGVALKRLEALDKKNLLPQDLAGALGFHARAAALAGEADEALFPVLEALRSDPRGAAVLEELPRLLRLDVPASEALKDLEALVSHLPAGEDPKAGLAILADLRRESPPGAHDGVREALAFVLGLPKDGREEQEEALRSLVRIEGDPASAMSDLRWLVAGHPDDLEPAARSYEKLARQTDSAGRAQIRKALDDLAGTPAPAAPRRRLLDWLIGGPMTREEAFGKLFEREGGRAHEALLDLKALERHAEPGEGLEKGLAEMEPLFRMKEAIRPGSVREAFELFRRAVPTERQTLRTEVEAWARELGDLDLGRRTVTVFRRAVDPHDRKARGEVLDRWRTEGLTPESAVGLFEACDEARTPGQALADVAARADRLMKDRSPLTVETILVAAARDARRPGSPFRSRGEALDHYLKLYSQGTGNESVIALQGFLAEEGHPGSYHDRSLVLSSCVRGSGHVGLGIEECRFIERTFPPAETLTAGKAYAGLLHALGTGVLSEVRASVRVEKARELLEWVRAEREAGHLGKSTLEEGLNALSSQLLVVGKLADAQEAVLEKFRPAREVDVEEEFVTIGGVQVPRRRASASPEGEG